MKCQKVLEPFYKYGQMENPSIEVRDQIRSKHVNKASCNINNTLPSNLVAADDNLGTGAIRRSLRF
jgi:hypothetical protein